MKIGIIGVGVVGGALFEAFQQAGVSAFPYDPFRGYQKYDSIPSCDVVFISVPTQTREDGKQDISYLSQVFQKLASVNFKGIACVKCTCLPGTTSYMSQTYGVKAVHSPEFLTAATPSEDLLNQPNIIIGGDTALSEVVFKAYQLTIPGAKAHYLATSEESELAKYMHNVFLSVKVEFFNEFKEVCDRVGAKYENIVTAVTSIGGIGSGHTRVPGPDGKTGFGGMCFPKDTEAFLAWANKVIGVDLIKVACWKNRKRRPEEYRTQACNLNQKETATLSSLRPLESSPV